MGFGSVFKVERATGAFTHIAALTGPTGSAPASAPHGRLVADGAGFRWGTTCTGGAADGGTIFKVNIAGGFFSGLADLTESTTGRFPYSASAASARIC